MAVLKMVTQEHSTVQEGGGSEMMAFGGGGSKVDNLKISQRLQAHPRDGLVLKIPRESTMGGGL